MVAPAMSRIANIGTAGGVTVNLDDAGVCVLQCVLYCVLQCVLQHVMQCVLQCVCVAISAPLAVCL